MSLFKNQYHITVKRIMYLFVVCLIFSCAHVVSPGGGLKDTQAPKKVKFQPENYSVHFKSKQAVLQFDEFIDFRNLGEQLLISPPLKEQPEIKVKKKSIWIDFSKTPLKDSTTYSINFGNSVVDVNESNAIENFQYVFSTGAFLDSLIIKGKIVDAKTGEPVKDASVMIYRNKNNDSLPLIEKPDYFTRTSEAGAFQIKNISSGKYKIFALKDANADFIYNQAGEAIAFLDSLIDAEKNEGIVLKMFAEEPRKQMLLKAYSPEFGRYVFIFKKPAMDIDIQHLSRSSEKKSWFIKEYNENKDTLTVWNTSSEKDTIVYKITDRSKLMRDTLLEMIPVNPDKEVKGRKKHKNSGLSFMPMKSNIHPYYKPVTFEMNHPILSYDTSKVLLKEDTIVVKQFSLSYVDTVRRKMQLNYKWKEKTNYKLQVLPGALNTVFGLTNDTVNINFKTSDPEQYGSMTLIVNTDSLAERNFIISLVNESAIEVWTKRIRKNETIELDHLEPGKYKLWAIEDKNNNGKWDAGNYLKKQQAENTFLYTEPIQIRANWDVETKWEIKNIK